MSGDAARSPLAARAITASSSGRGAVRDAGWAGSRGGIGLMITSLRDDGLIGCPPPRTPRASRRCGASPRCPTVESSSCRVTTNPCAVADSSATVPIPEMVNAGLAAKMIIDGSRSATSTRRWPIAASWLPERAANHGPPAEAIPPNRRQSGVPRRAAVSQPSIDRELVAHFANSCQLASCAEPPRAYTTCRRPETMRGGD